MKNSILFLILLLIFFTGCKKQDTAPEILTIDKNIVGDWNVTVAVGTQVSTDKDVIAYKADGTYSCGAILFEVKSGKWTINSKGQLNMGTSITFSQNGQYVPLDMDVVSNEANKIVFRWSGPINLTYTLIRK